MLFSFIFETHSDLEKLKKVGEIIAKFQDWHKLYENDVPIYGTTFVDDAYIDL
jgi:hypothetical protein